MRLVFLHGAPASGKLTVATELAALTGARLFDNHVAIDLALSILDFGALGFWDLVTEVRDAALRAGARADLPLMITTAAYSHPDDLRLYEAYEAIVEGDGGRILPVHLSCPEELLMSRVGAVSRVRRRKIATRETLSAYLARNDFAPVPREACLELSTASTPAMRTAEVIADHFGLPRSPRPQGASGSV